MKGPAIAVWPAMLLLAACSVEPTPATAVSADEERQLNDAAAMLDANSVDPDTVIVNEGAP